jgi:hypothetical protein
LAPNWSPGFFELKSVARTAEAQTLPFARTDMPLKRSETMAETGCTYVIY